MADKRLVYRASKGNGDRKERKRQRGRKLRRRSLFVVVLVFIGVLCLVVPVIGAGVLITTMPKVELKDLPPIQTSVIYASDGRVIARLHGEQNRTVVPLKKIPQELLAAVIAIEDSRYYEHVGVDYIGIGRALATDLQEGRFAQGFSTITMQYAKDAFLTNEKTLARKLQQTMLAMQLEKKYSKDQILEMYLNRIYFGSGAYGVQVASETYFDKPVSELELHEAAMLAGIIQRPERYNPFVDPDATKRRRDVVLGRMADLKIIDQRTADEAISKPIKVRNGRPKEFTRVPYFVDYIKREISRRYGAGSIYKGGYRIHTTLDLDMQAKAEKAVNNTLNRPGDPSASLVAIDVKTGAIKVMVGGKDYKKSKYNLAVQGKRQPGSSFKPFVLATAINAKMSPYSAFPAPGSIRLKYDGTAWPVSNYSDSRRTGTMNLIDSTVYSVNTVYAQLILKVGVKKVVTMAHKLGVKSELTENPAIALGGLKHGVNALEMAGAYGTFARRGAQIEPWAIDRVLDSSGALIEKTKPAKKRVMAQNDADTINSILQSVVTRGTGTRARIGRPVAGKTGTAQDYKDAWFVGYSPDIAVAVWMGYMTPRPMTSVHGVRVTGGSLPTTIWASFMRSIIGEYPYSRFSKPALGGKVLTADGEVTKDVASKKDPVPKDKTPVTTTSSTTTTLNLPPVTTTSSTTTTTIPATTTTTLPGGGSH